MIGDAREVIWQRTPALDERFLAATGRVRVLEDKLLSRDELLRLANPELTESEREVFLTKAGYGGEAKPEQRLLKARDENDRLLYDLCAKAPLLAEFLLIDLDYHNVKAIIRYVLLKEAELRSVKAGGGRQALLQSLDERPKALEAMLRVTAPTAINQLYPLLMATLAGRNSLNTGGLREIFVGHLKQIAACSAEDPSLAAVDRLADRLCFAERVAMLQQREAGQMRPFMRDYTAMLADIANLDSLLRIRRAGADKSLLVQVLVPGGDINPEDIKDLYAEDEARIFKRFSSSLIMKALTGANEGSTGRVGDFSLFKDKVLGCIARLSKKTTASAEVVTGYWLSKQLEIRNLRILLQQAVRGTDAETRRAAIRPAFRGEG